MLQNNNGKRQQKKSKKIFHMKGLPAKGFDDFGWKRVRNSLK
jgi:hypothetical protein